jgi:predicted secreted protein
MKLPNGTPYKPTHIAAAVAALFVLLSVGTTVLFFTQRTSYDADGTNLKKFSGATVREVNGQSFPVTQTYQTIHAGLQSISFAVLNQTQPNVVTATLTNEKGGQAVASAVITVPVNPNPQYAELRFNPLDTAADQTLTLRIDLSGARQLQLLTVPHDRYPAGLLDVNGTPVSTESLIFTARYHTANAAVAALHRLALVAPPPFNHPATDVVLFCLLIVVAGGALYIFSRQLLEQGPTVPASPADDGDPAPPVR